MRTVPHLSLVTDASPALVGRLAVPSPMDDKPRTLPNGRTLALCRRGVFWQPFTDETGAFIAFAIAGDGRKVAELRLPADADGDEADALEHRLQSVLAQLDPMGPRRLPMFGGEG